MARVKIRLEVPELNQAYDVYIDLDSSPMVVAQGLGDRIGLEQGTRFLRLRDTFQIRDGSTLELVSETVDPFTIAGDPTPIR